MNKDLVQGNKIIYQKMHKKERLRHLHRLQQIKNRNNSQQPVPFNLFRQTSLYDAERNLEIERNNIALFNKIASILKERPKIEVPRSRHFVKSLDQAMFKQERKMQELKTRNEDLLKRLTRQQPTIKNEEIFKDRIRNQHYLSFIGKYPFKKNRRSNTEFQLSHECKEEVFHQKTLDFDISIQHKPETDEYMFTVKDLMESKAYQLSMEGERFKEELAACQLSYEKMIGKLRMEKQGQMVFGEGDLQEISQQKQK